MAILPPLSLRGAKRRGNLRILSAGVPCIVIARARKGPWQSLWEQFPAIRHCEDASASEAISGNWFTIVWEFQKYAKREIASSCLAALLAMTRVWGLLRTPPFLAMTEIGIFLVIRRERVFCNSKKGICLIIMCNTFF